MPDNIQISDEEQQELDNLYSYLNHTSLLNCLRSIKYEHNNKPERDLYAECISNHWLGN